MTKKRKSDQPALTPLDLHTIIADQQQVIANLRRQLRKEIEFSHTDSLTSCFNRRGHKKMTAQEQERINIGECQSGIVLSIDMRRLKAINDGHGHAAGDKAIVTFSKKLKSLLRKTDIVSRTGGDEFIVIMPDTTPQESAKKRLQIKETLSNVQFEHEGKTLSVGVRYGVARYNQEITIEAALKTADFREGKIRENLRKLEKPRYG